MTNPGNAVGTNGAYGGRTSVNAMNDILSAFSGPGIVSGWKAVPGGALNVKLGGDAKIRDVAIVENNLGQRMPIDNISTQPIEVELETAPNAGQRIDVIVGYINNPPDAVVTDPIEIDNPSVCGLIAVAGNVSNTPTAPTESMIRTAMTADGAAGQAAYYVILATITIPAGLTTITAANIKMGDSATLGSTALADGSVTNQKIQDGAVTRNKLATNLLTELMNLRTYTVNPDSNGVLNITDSTLPSTPVDGLQFLVRPSAVVTNAKISLNGGAAVAGVVQAPVGGRSTAERNSNFSLDANSWYLVVFGASYWRFINTFDVIRTHDIVDGAITAAKIADFSIDATKLASNSVSTYKLQDGAVTAAKADIEGIMNSAGDNGQLFGLGGKAIAISNADLNSLIKTGFYIGDNLTNAPVTAPTTWFFIEHIRYNDDYCVQVARSWYDGNVWQRGKAGTWRAWKKLMTSADTLNQIYPVGSIYVSGTLDTPAKVAAALGGGTWIRNHEGRAIVGYKSDDSDFNTIKDGGAKTVTLTIDQIPSHNHNVNSLWSGGSGSGTRNTINGYPVTKNGEYNVSTDNKGGGQAHNNLSPYSVRYVYKRTA